MSDTDFISLYSKQLLALAGNIPHHQRLEAPDGSGAERSPLCGSRINVDICLSHGRISAFGQEVKACALGQASAALLGQVIIGRSRTEMQSGHDALEAMLKHNAPPPAAPFEGFHIFMAAQSYSNRHTSILLPFKAVLKAFEAAEKK